MTLSRRRWEQVVGSTQEGTLVVVLGETMTPLSSGINKFAICAEEERAVRKHFSKGSDKMPSLLILKGLPFW